MIYSVNSATNALDVRIKTTISKVTLRIFKKNASDLHFWKVKEKEIYLSTRKKSIIRKYERLRKKGKNFVRDSKVT